MSVGYVLSGKIAELERELDALRTIAAQLAAEVKALEWRDEASTLLELPVFFCPRCRVNRRYGHAGTGDSVHQNAKPCSLAAALEAWEAYRD